MNRKTHMITLLIEKPEHYLCKSTESHHIQNLFQRILWSYLTNFVGTFSTAYFSLLLAITEKSPYFLPNITLIAIGIYFWSFPGCHHYIATDQFVHIHEENRIHIQRQKHFHQLKCHMIHLGGKNLDIVASSIISMHDIDKHRILS